MKVLYCGYRRWANDILEYLISRIGIPFYLIKTKEELKNTNTSEYDLLLFVGWSWIIPASIVNKRNCVCVHPSPLPKYRGGSPLQHQIINGEKESMVSLFLMDNGIDTGPIIIQEPFSLEGELDDVLQRMTEAGKKAIEKFLVDYLKTHIIISKDQNHSEATTFKRRTKAMSEITIDDIKNSTAEQLYNKVRCLQDPYPNAYITCKNGTRLYIEKAKLFDLAHDIF